MQRFATMTGIVAVGAIVVVDGRACVSSAAVIMSSNIDISSPFYPCFCHQTFRVPATSQHHPLHDDRQPQPIPLTRGLERHRPQPKRA